VAERISSERGRPDQECKATWTPLANEGDSNRFPTVILPLKLTFPATNNTRQRNFVMTEAC